MGGEGAMMAANNSLKNNRSLLAKRNKTKALEGSYANIELKYNLKLQKHNWKVLNTEFNLKINKDA